MEIIDIVGLAGIPVIVAFTEATKPFVTDKRYWPWVAVAWGIILNVAVALIAATDMPTAAIYGGCAGLAAAGLWSAAGKQVRSLLP